MNIWKDVCTGCLSRGRCLTKLTGAAEGIFNDIVVAAGGTESGAVCWECKARLHSAMKFRSMVTIATQTLASCQLNVVNYVTSLSGLSCHNTSHVIDAIHDKDSAPGGPKYGPVFVKIEDDIDSYMDDSINFDAVDVEVDIKPVLKSESIENKERLKKESNRKKKRHKRRLKETKKKDEENFDDSDDEPLASKTALEEDINDSSETKRPGRGRREGAAGVLRNPRVEARLAGLGVAPGALDMIALSWEETAGELECSACSVRFRSAHALAAHRRRHRVRWRCGACGALWSRAAVAADHLRRAHAHDAPAPTHTCPVCLHKAPTLNKLRTHMRSHAPRQPCPECGKIFRDRASLRTHLFSHRADKEHSCPKCPARFLYPRSLKLHLLTHDPPAPFYCHQCDTQFRNPMSYYQHMKYSLKHVQPAQLKHACETCGARFVRAARLADHVAAKHTHLAPHHCEHQGCTYKSASRAVLRAHARSAHSPRAPRRRLVCHLCGRTYTTKKSLERHFRTHSDSGLPSRADQNKNGSNTLLSGIPMTDSVSLYNNLEQNVDTQTYKKLQKET